MGIMASKTFLENKIMWSQILFLSAPSQLRRTGWDNQNMKPNLLKARENKHPPHPTTTNLCPHPHKEYSLGRAFIFDPNYSHCYRFGEPQYRCSCYVFSDQIKVDGKTKMKEIFEAAASCLYTNLFHEVIPIMSLIAANLILFVSKKGWSQLRRTYAVYILPEPACPQGRNFAVSSSYSLIISLPNLLYTVATQ